MGERETKNILEQSEIQGGLRIVTAPQVGEQCGMSTPLTLSHLDQEAAIDELPAIANPRSKDLSTSMAAAAIQTIAPPQCGNSCPLVLF